MPKTPSQKALAGRIAGYTRAANLSAKRLSEIGRMGYRGLWAKWATEVDPEGTMESGELARRVEALKAAHYARISLASSIKRGAKRKGKETRKANATPIA